MDEYCQNILENADLSALIVPPTETSGGASLSARFDLVLRPTR
jgi:hypothetical protein